ncbi:MAG: sigma-70 family RNA polymerase sigma factor [Planctomycetota bacterium]
MSEFEGMLKHSNWLQPLARDLLGDEHLAEDVLQQTWITAWRRAPREQQAGPAWLKQVLHNFVRMQFRGDGRRRKRERLTARPEAFNEDLAVEAHELHREIVHALSRLDEPFRSTLVLRFYEDLTSAEIARRQGIPAATVRVRLKRGLDRLRDQLNSSRESYLPALFLLAGLDLPGLSPTDAQAQPTPTTEKQPAAATKVGHSHARWAAAFIVIAAVALLSLLLVDSTDTSGAPTRSSQRPLTNSSLVHHANPPTLIDHRNTPHSPADVHPVNTQSIDDEVQLEGALRGDTLWAQLQVVDAAGMPIANARVASDQRRLQLKGIAAGYASTYEYLLAEQCPDLLGFTGSNGRLRVPAATLRDAALAVSAKSHVALRERPAHRQLVDGVYAVTLQPALDTQITVHATGDSAIRDCTVTVTDGKTTASYLTSSDSRVTHSSPEEVEVVSFQAAGFAAAQELLSSPLHEQRLQFGHPSSGVVVDADGQPIVGATVSMRSTLWRGPAYAVTTDAQGCFETFGLPESGTLDLEIRHGDYPLRKSTYQLPSDGLGEIQLETPQRLRGQIITTAGVPIANATIYALPDGKFLSRDLQRCRSDANGAFDCGPVRAGDYILYAEHPNFAATEVAASTSNAQPTIVRLSEGTFITGRVQTGNGQPVAGVPVRIGVVVGDELRGPVVYSDASGHFRCTHVPRGEVTHRPRRQVVRWRALSAKDSLQPTTQLIAELFLPYQLLRANGEDVPQPAHFGSRNTVAVQAGTELTLTIAEPRPRSTVRFELTDTAGAPIRAFSNVLIVSPNGWTMKDFAGIDGQPYHFPNPWVLDDAQLTMMSRGYCWQTLRVDLRHSTNRVRFQLEPAFAEPATLVLDGLAGNSQAPVELLVAPLVAGVAPLAALPIGTAAENGHLALPHCGPGRYALCTPRDPESILGKSGQRRLALPMDELYTIGHFTLSAAEGQIVPVQLARTANSEETR